MEGSFGMQHGQDRQAGLSPQLCSPSRQHVGPWLWGSRWPPKLRGSRKVHEDHLPLGYSLLTWPICPPPCPPSYPPPIQDTCSHQEAQLADAYKQLESKQAEALHARSDASSLAAESGSAAARVKMLESQMQVRAGQLKTQTVIMVTSNLL